MIENDHQLERAYDLVGQLIRLREQALQEPLWHESLQREVADGIEAQRRKIERRLDGSTTQAPGHAQSQRSQRHEPQART